MSKPLTTAAELRVEILKLLALYDTQGRALVDTLRLDEDLGLDSLDVVELVMDVEKLINEDISDELTEKWRTIGDVLATAERIAFPQP